MMQGYVSITYTYNNNSKQVITVATKWQADGTIFLEKICSSIF